MVEKKVLNRFARIFDDNYNKTDLDTGWRKLVIDFIKTNITLCYDEGLTTDLKQIVEQKKFNKETLCKLVAIPFGNKKLFQAFRASLDKKVQTVLDELVWNTSKTHEQLEKEFDIVIYKKKNSTYYESYNLAREFQLFKYKSTRSYYSSAKPDFTLYLPLDFRKLLVNYYERPAGAFFNPIQTIEKTDYTYTSEQDILLEFPRIKAYKSQGHIKTTNSSKPQASTLGKMQRKLKLKEFYSDTDNKLLKTLRTSLLAALVVHIDSADNETNTTLVLKQLMEKYYRSHFTTIHGVLTCLTGSGHINRYNVKSPEGEFFQLFKKMPVNEWISIRNIEKYIQYNFMEIAPVSEYTAGDKLYYNLEAESRGYKYKEKHYIDNSRYYDSLIMPSIKGTCFLFAAYGLLDVAYDTPNMEELGVTAQSHYDGLKYIRLTALGDYVLGNTSEYDTPDSIAKSSISLSESSLTITVDESDTTAPILLEPYTQRASSNRYKTDFSFFLKGVKTQKELESKIALFKQAIRMDFPANWLHFFEELRSKIDPLTTVRAAKVFLIPSENKELLQLIAKDAKLQKLCLKAEGFHIIVTSANLTRFKTRLQEFGYLLP